MRSVCCEFVVAGQRVEDLPEPFAFSEALSTGTMSDRWKSKRGHVQTKPASFHQHSASREAMRPS